MSRSENRRAARPPWIRSGQMQGLLAAVIALAAGCGFHAPEASAGPDAGTDPSGDAPAARCTTTYDYVYSGHRYRLVESGMKWAEAKTSCEADGGYLLEIDSSAEDNQAANAFFGGPQEVWIGLRDASNDGSYRWTNDMPPSYTHWNGAAPNAGSPDCVVKNTYFTDGHWYTRDCEDDKAVLCECNP
jgi:lectin-like protein